MMPKMAAEPRTASARSGTVEGKGEEEEEEEEEEGWRQLGSPGTGRDGGRTVVVLQPCRAEQDGHQEEVDLANEATLCPSLARDLVGALARLGRRGVVVVRLERKHGRRWSRAGCRAGRRRRPIVARPRTSRGGGGAGALLAWWTGSRLTGQLVQLALRCAGQWCSRASDESRSSKAASWLARERSSRPCAGNLRTAAASRGGRLDECAVCGPCRCYLASQQCS